MDYNMRFALALGIFVAASFPIAVLAQSPREPSRNMGGATPGGGEHDEDSARTDYQLAERIASAAAWQAFLAKHPSGFYADLARAQLEKLGVTAANPPAAEPAPGGMANQVHMLRA